MGAPDRTVRHLRLRAQDEAGVRRGARQLEDALRCATLPDDGGRLLLVRRLDLGRFDGALSSQSLSLLIERRVAALGFSWVHGGAPQAEQANAVWFTDRSEALLVFALRIAEGTIPAAWFWPQVLPALRYEREPSVLMRCVIEALCEEVHALHSLPRLLGELIEQGHAEKLPMLLDVQARALLARAAVHLQFAHRSAVMDVEQAPARMVWRTAAGMRCEIPRGILETLPGLPVFLAAARWLPVSPEPVRASLSPVDEPNTTSSPSQQQEETDEAAALRAVRDPSEGLSPERAPLGHPENVIETDLVSPAMQAAAETPAFAKPEAVAKSEAAAPQFDEMLATRAGGLLFLLPVLVRLGFVEWSASVSLPVAQHVVADVLQQALRRLRIEAEDPAHAIPAALKMRVAPDIEFTSPALWRDGRIAMPDCTGTFDAAFVADLWLRAARRYLRRVAQIGLASLVLRPAGVRATATHLDMFFDLRATDLRVRRAALDLDPGWLPWLGRVVGFHYRQGLSL